MNADWVWIRNETSSQTVLTLEMFDRIEMKRFETAKTEAFKRHQKIGTGRVLKIR